MLSRFTQLSFNGTYLIEYQSNHTAPSVILELADGNCYLVNCDKSVEVSYMNGSKQAIEYIRRVNTC